MTREEIIQRLAAHRLVGSASRAELEWLADHGQLHRYAKGDLIARRDQPIVELSIVFSGRFAIHVDQRPGSRRVLEWRGGDLSGKLPYSRMGQPPGDTVVEEETESLSIDQSLFPEMIRECPTVTSTAVHVMLDRARHFNTWALQDEKIMSLGKLSAGLAHELNNPASAAVRSAQLLSKELRDAEDASRAIGAIEMSAAQQAEVERVREICLQTVATVSRAPIEQSDRVDEISDWLLEHGADDEVAAALADTAITMVALDQLAETVEGDALDVALRWIASGCTTRALAHDIERATSRIHQLVSSVKRFTYMDRAVLPEAVDVAQLLSDTATVLASKARGKSVALKLDVQPDLPPALGIGGELNQVWLNLMDNAIDAVASGGSVTVSAKHEPGWVVVRVIDDGAGIPDDVRSRIFDPFFTTKPPGQGTGLGLDIVQRVVRAHRAEIDVDTKPGRTEFRVALPLADQAAS
jgi:signal transduction histidine kinase